MNNNFRLILNYYGAVNYAYFSTQEDAEVVLNEIQVAKEKLNLFNRDDKTVHKFTANNGTTFLVTLKDLLTVVIEDLNKLDEFNTEMAVRTTRNTKATREALEKEGLLEYAITKEEIIKESRQNIIDNN